MCTLHYMFKRTKLTSSKDEHWSAVNNIVGPRFVFSVWSSCIIFSYNIVQSCMVSDHKLKQKRNRRSPFSPLWTWTSTAIHSCAQILARLALSLYDMWGKALPTQQFYRLLILLFASLLHLQNVFDGRIGLNWKSSHLWLNQKNIRLSMIKGKQNRGTNVSNIEMFSNIASHKLAINELHLV